MSLPEEHGLEVIKVSGWGSKRSKFEGAGDRRKCQGVCKLSPLMWRDNGARKVSKVNYIEGRMYFSGLSALVRSKDFIGLTASVRKRCGIGGLVGDRGR